MKILSSRGVSNPIGETHNVSWKEFCDLAREHSIARSNESEQTKREGAWFSPAEYKGNHRRRENIIGKPWAIVADLDEIYNPKAIEKALSRWEYIAWTTWRSTPEKPRWRVVLPIEGGIEPERFGALVDRVLAPIANFAKVDPRTRMVEQLWFWPEHKRSRARDHVVWTNSGSWVRAGQIISVDFTGVRLATKPEEVKAGDRNNSLVLRLNEADALRCESEDELFEIAQAWNARLPEPMDRREVRGIVRKKWRWLQTPQGVMRRALIARYQPQADGGAVRLTVMNSKTPEFTRWLWPEYIARSVPNLLAGEGGLGKSQIAIAIAAAVSSGGRFPDGTRAPRGKVVILSAEDHATRVLLPRLIAAGADTGRIYLLEGTVDFRSKLTRVFSFEHDLEKLKAKIREVGDVAMVIIDPISAYMGLKVDSHQTSHVRSWLMPIAAFAETLDCALLIVAHFNKSGEAKRAVDRISGSAAWSQAARRVLFVLADGERRLFLRGKTNLSPFDRGGFEFTIEQASIGDGIPTSRVKWGVSTDERADDVLITPAEPRGVAAAKKWLRERLASGAVSVHVLEDEAEQHGVAWRSLKRAKAQLRVASVKKPNGWWWSLPVTTTPTRGKRAS